MPITFTITKSRQALERQWTYLVKLGREKDLFALKVFFLLLLVCTVLYFLLYFFTDPDNLVVFKVMGMIVIAFMWCFFAVRCVIFRRDKSKTYQKLQALLDSIAENQLNYSVQIDEENVTIQSTGQTLNLPWADFSQFGIHDETVYVFNLVSGNSLLFWDQSEMGSEAYLALLELLQRKSIKQAF